MLALAITLITYCLLLLTWLEAGRLLQDLAAALVTYCAGSLTWPSAGNILCRFANLAFACRLLRAFAAALVMY